MTSLRIFFEMPPVIGDPHLPHQRAVEVVSADFGEGETQQPMDPSKLKGVNLRLAVPHDRQFMDAFQSDMRYPYAILWIHVKGERFEETLRVEMKDIEVRGYTEYHGDIVVSLEFREIKGQLALFNAVKVAKAFMPNYARKWIGRRLARQR